ncbi:Predicted amidohydrolase [Chitinophaga sp. YR627]|uniref:carbon-nitrogen hydrolase family protein n=1 Tax=Chitinophaga sp. YR627 TaxID=1881041 RepID=UPI0008E227D5|nr:carbon-nitrogen hydrolase family protein [Chitinophaga sp. YR627]SFN92750.1 Predicted amidohydrolase [Chitinophaga sp. YR627]
MKIALASPPFPKSLQDGLFWLEKLVKEAVAESAAIICFPESYLPGYPGMGYAPEDRSRKSLLHALAKVCDIAAAHAITIIVPMDWYIDEQLVNLAFVVSEKGDVLGYQTKNQLDPTEDELWTAGTTRSIFEVNGVKFGITICHEGFRYPESVRWAAQQDAKIVFMPHFGGSETEGVELKEWGAKENPYYEKAVMLRAMENTVYTASSNYAARYSHAATSLVAPDGSCVAHEAYGRVGVIVGEIDPEKATGLLAKRFKNALYHS